MAFYYRSDDVIAMKFYNAFRESLEYNHCDIDRPGFP